MGEEQIYDINWSWITKDFDIDPPEVVDLDSVETRLEHICGYCIIKKGVNMSDIKKTAGMNERYAKDKTAAVYYPRGCKDGFIQGRKLGF